MLDIARTLTASTSVHALAGSSRPGAAPTVTLGATAAPEMAGMVAGAVTRGHQDAEVIDLAGRVKALAERELRLVLRVCRIEDAAMDAKAPYPVKAEWALQIAYQHSVEPDGTRVTVIREPAGWAAETKANREAFEAALAERERQEESEGARHGLPFWVKLRERAIGRLERWGLQLAAMEPTTQAGLAAKAAASAAVAEDGVLPDAWRQKLATSLSRDALRIICAEADVRAEQDRQADGELFHYGRRWEATDLEHRAAEAAMEASWHSFIASAPAIPEEMFVSDEDHHRVGPYVRPHGVDGRMWYGDPDTLKMLREGYPKDISADRRAEILAANDRWVAANDAARREARCDALEAAEEAAATRENTARRAMLLTPAHTMDGLLLKARAAMSQWGGSDHGLVGLERKLRAAINGDATDEAAMAVLVDLASMASAEPAAIPATGTVSNLRPVPLPADLSALRLGADAAGDVREWYRSWLYAELRLLNLELDGSAEGSGIRQDNPGAAFHYPAEASWTDVPKPSTRAAAVLDLFGILPRHDGTGDLARVA